MAIGGMKRLLIGQPLPTHQLVHERLNKIQGLAVFSSDALSSSAYATEEILLVLVTAGPLAMTLGLPVALAISTVLAIVAFSYYQTIHAYPSGGGSYIVSHENLGVWPGLVAASSLMIDYVLTVSVSVSAGVAAITSAVPALFDYRVDLGLAAVALIAVINLRGVRESGTIFSVPTYLFIFTMFGMLVAGFARSWGAPAVPVQLPEQPAGTLHTLTLFLILKAFASGSAAMTGVEAISNGIPAFRRPESHNAGITLIWMATILATLFLGITYLSRHYGLVPLEHETIVSQLARTVFGDGPAYYLAQASTALILILAANTSFADFPRLASILARDRFVPHQLANLGDRLVYANGIVLLAIFSGMLIYIFGASTHHLIPLYAVGVFLSFTLSQTGMVKKWWTSRAPGWRRSMVINAIGAVATGIVLVVVATVKFHDGAWIVILLIPTFVMVMRSIWLHYEDVRRHLTLEGAQVPSAVRQHKVIIPVGGINRGTLPALQYARSISDDVTAVMVEIDPAQTADVQKKWERWGMGVPLKVLTSPYRSVAATFLEYLSNLEWEVGFDQQLTVVLPEFVPTRWWHFLLHNQNALLLKAALFFRRRAGRYVTVVTDVPYYLGAEETALPYQARERRDPLIPTLVGLCLAAFAGYVAAALLGLPLWLETTLGVTVIVLLAAAGVAWFKRPLKR
jgi:amino acid transporter